MKTMVNGVTIKYFLNVIDFPVKLKIKKINKPTGKGRVKF
jgi:hypothetical protein